jgi:hypothetical protein
LRQSLEAKVLFRHKISNEFCSKFLRAASRSGVLTPLAVLVREEPVGVFVADGVVRTGYLKEGKNNLVAAGLFGNGGIILTLVEANEAIAGANTP